MICNVVLFDEIEFVSLRKKGNLLSSAKLLPLEYHFILKCMYYSILLNAILNLNFLIQIT